MEQNNLIVSDTSPLLNLAFIGQIQLLESQFGKIDVPEQVWSEIQEGKKGRELLENYREELLKIVEVEEDSLYRELRQGLDRGESAAIAYAIQKEADLVLLDEKEGRNSARNHGIETTGVIGILIKAAQKGEINLEKQLDLLREEGFWISDELYDKIIGKYS